MKQLPGIFVLMSHKRKNDYKEVLAEMTNLLPSPPVAELLVADFEEGLWRDAKLVFSEMRIRGCAFHWGQAVWRHVQELGLQIDYTKLDSTHKFIRKLHALPFLPEEQIPPTFYALKETTATTQRLSNLCDYIGRTWITGDTWTPATWTVYRMAVRTNNDVEGWHHRLNRKARKPCLPFYVLITLLFQEASAIPTQLKMISEEKLRRYQKKPTRHLQSRINQLWEAYNEGKISVNKLLKKCGLIYGGQ